MSCQLSSLSSLSSLLSCVMIQKSRYLAFINIFLRVQKRTPFFDQTFGCWDSFRVLNLFRVLKPGLYIGLGLRTLNSCSGWFFFFLLNTPIQLNHDGCINRIKEKSPRVEVGFLFQNHLILTGWKDYLSNQRSDQKTECVFELAEKYQ